MAETTPATEDDPQEYVIRPYESDDADDVLSLFASVWETERSEAWLEFLYERNPFHEGASMLVADAGNEVVGVRPSVPLPMRVRSVDVTCAYLHNVMVHPDHRRRGLFKRLTKRLVDHLGDGTLSLLFCYANDLSAPGYQKTDFQSVGRGPVKHVRLQSPDRFVSDRLQSPFDDVVGSVANAATWGYLSAKEFDRSVSTDLHVERQSGIPAETLTALYETDPPESLHVRREVPLYRWFETDPYWEYETYVASRDDSPVAAVVLRNETDSSADDPWIVDAVPTASSRHSGAYETLLDAVVTDYRDARKISISGPVVYERLFPTAVLSDFGFLSSDRFPLSRVTRDTNDTVFVYSYGSAVEEAGVDITAAENWQLSVR